MPIAVNVLGKCWAAAFDLLGCRNKNASETVENIDFRGFSHVPPVGFEPTTHDLFSWEITVFIIRKSVEKRWNFKDLDIDEC